LKEIKISQVDTLFVNGVYQIEFLFYFKKNLDIQYIRNALKKLAPLFWPMFGDYKNGVISFEKYDENDFCQFEVVDQEMAIPTNEEEKLSVYSQYKLHDTKKLFLLKVMQFKNGTVLVPRMSHLAGDGYSYFYFLSALASLSQHNILPSKSTLMQLFFKPHHRRAILRDFSFEGADWKPQQEETSFTMGMEEVRRKDVNLLIRKISESQNLRVSTNDVLTAMSIKKLAEVQKDSTDEFVELTIPIDVRRKVKEYGRRFFGNGIMLHRSMLKREDITKLSVEQVAMQIRKSMPSLSTQSFTNYLKGLEETFAGGKTEKFRPFDPDSGFLVTNISRLPVDRLNFGTGPPDLIFPFTVEKNAAAVLARDENFILRFAY
jgi:hypothetical protein